MRCTALCVISALVGALPLLAETPSAPPLTVVLDFKQARPNRVVEEMKRATEEIVAGSGLRLNWKMRSEVGSDSFPELVLVTLYGSCAIHAGTPRITDPGPLALSHIVDAQVLPFADVYCDRVASATRAAMTQTELFSRDQGMGRALAKVLAHELMHMVTKSTAHGTSGVAKAALSGRQLLDNDTVLEPDDLDRIRDEGGR